MKKIESAFESYNAVKTLDKYTIRSTMLNHINLSKKLIEFLGKNIKTIMFLENGYSKNNYSYLRGCNSLTIKRTIENYGRILNKVEKIDLVSSDLDELEEMLK